MAHTYRMLGLTRRRPTVSLRRQLIMLVAGLVVPLLILQTWWTLHDYRLAREQAETNSLAVADAISLGVVQFFSQAEQLMMATTNSFGLGWLVDEACAQHMETVTTLLPFLRNAVAVAEDGEVLCSAMPAPSGLSAREWAWWDAVQRNPEFTLGQPVEGVLSGDWILPMVAPVVDEDGAFAGAIVGTVALVELSALFGDVTIQDDYLVTVATADRIVIARSTEPESRVGSSLPPLTGSDREVAPGRWVASGPDLAGVERTWGQVEIDPGWIVYVGVPDALVFGPAIAEAATHVGATLLVVILGILFAGVSYRRIAAALRELADRTRAIAGGQIVPLPPDTPEEVSEVVQQFNHALKARDRAEVSERTARRRYESLFDNAVFGLYVSTPDGRFLQVNRALVDMLGYETEGDLIDVGPRALYSDPNLRAELVERALSTEEVTAEEVDWVRADGIPITVRVGGKLIPGPDGSPVFEMIVQDITEEKRTEDELRQTQKMEAVGQLAGGIAHDLNNILTVIGGNLELLEDELPPSDLVVDELDQIGRATRRATGLTRRLLSFSRKQRSGRQIVEVNEVIRGLARMLVPTLGERVTLDVDFDSSGLHVDIDPGELEQIVLNLVLNARDAMPRGGRVIISTHAEPASREGALDCALLRVADSGIGIDPALRPRIFEPFYTTKPMGQGTGLGLSTVYGIVQRAGGSVDVESAPGVGTTLSVRLPLVGAAEHGERPGIADRGADGGSERILVVEDDPMVGRFVVRALREAGYVVGSVASGQEALDVLHAEAGEVDLVLTDVVMPGVSGQELAERLALTHPKTSVLFMSGYVDDRVLSEAFDLSPDRLLSKPFTAAQLRAGVRRALDRRPSQAPQD